LPVASVKAFAIIVVFTAITERADANVSVLDAIRWVLATKALIEVKMSL
jgi:hypothetical protein